MFIFPEKKAFDALAARMLAEEAAVEVQLKIYLKACDNPSIIKPIPQVIAAVLDPLRLKGVGNRAFLWF